MNKLIENQLKKNFINKKIISRKIISTTFNIQCEKITLNNNKTFIAKYYTKKNKNFNSIKSEANSLIFLSKKFSSLFPSLKFYSNNLLLVDYIMHVNIKKGDYQIILAKKILRLHNVSNKYYGFDFDTQIGGLRQPNQYEANWLSFFRDKRLNMIFEIINSSNPMPKKINIQIEKLIKDLENRIPKYPKISLLHGDLWEGNILFNKGKLVALIDPGVFFGHNEFEIAYLTWFKYVDTLFLETYSNFIKIEKNFAKYESIYQLYYCLLNIHLWSGEYINEAAKLLKKIKL